MSRGYLFDLANIEERIESDFEIIINFTKIIRAVPNNKFYYKFNSFSKKRTLYGKFNPKKCIEACSHYFSKISKFDSLINANNNIAIPNTKYICKKIKILINLINYVIVFVNDLQIHLPIININLYSSTINLFNVIYFSKEYNIIFNTLNNIKISKKYNILRTQLKNDICKFQQIMKKLWMQNINLFICLPTKFIINMITSKEDLFYIFFNSHLYNIWLDPKLIDSFNKKYLIELKIILGKINLPNSVFLEIMSFLFIKKIKITDSPNYNKELCISNGINPIEGDLRPVRTHNYTITI